MHKNRDFKKEYQRRIANAAKRGLSRSQARGHARAHEAPARPRRQPIHDDRLEAALRGLRHSGNQITAAKSVGIAPERFRRFLRENVRIEGRGRSLKIRDDRLRRMSVISGGEIRDLTLRGFDQASLNGEYLNAVRSFLSSNDIELLSPFAGRAVIDAKGQAHPFETDPNTLHRLAAAESELFTDIYRLIL
jgi:hypothetical protein